MKVGRGVLFPVGGLAASRGGSLGRGLVPLGAFLDFDPSLLLASCGVLGDVLAMLEVSVQLGASLSNCVEEGPHTREKLREN